MPSVSILRVFLFLISALGAFFLQAAPANIPDRGELLLDESSYGKFSVVGADRPRVEIKEAEVKGPGFSKALRVRTIKGGSNFLKVQAALGGTTPLARGDVLLARFFVRTVESPGESGEGETQFELEDRKTFNISGQFAVHAIHEWREIFVPLRQIRESEAGDVVINFRVGNNPQTIEIGGLQVFGYGSKLKITDLPATSVSSYYEGIEADAPWREAARQRIERYRMSELKIEVSGVDGSAVADAAVIVRQKTHAYRFGAAVRANRIVAETEEGKRYRQSIRRFFNTITLENDLKWSSWVKDRETPQRAAEWAVVNNIAVRGHTMVWAHYGRVPASLTDVIGKPGLLREAVNAHIKDIGSTMSPKVIVWDVLNEPFRNRAYMDLLGDEEMISWFKLAHASAPEATLMVNDYGIISGGGMDEQHQAYFERNVQFLLDGGAPLGGLGFQGHFGRILTPPERMLQILDRFGRFGKPIEMTEYSTQIDDRDLSAAYLRDVLTVFFSHPSTDGFILWGYQDGFGYKHTGTLEAKDGSLTQAGRIWMDMIYNQWWTKADLLTSKTGEASVRAFNGDYEITVSHAGKTTRVTATLSASANPVRVQLIE